MVVNLFPSGNEYTTRDDFLPLGNVFVTIW